VKNLTRRVVLNSWHSQALQIISDAVREDFYGVLLSVDGHLDMHIATQDRLDLLPTELLKLVEMRSAAHFEIRRITGGVPLLQEAADHGEEKVSQSKMFVAVPIGQVAAQAKKLLEYRLPDSKDTLLDTAMSVVAFHEKYLGVHIHPSPPHRLAELLPLMKYDDVLLDVDVDYFYEMQHECYSPLANASSEDLGHVAPMLHLIKKVRPLLITISEMTFEAFANPSSTINSMLDWLRRRGYSIERGNIFSSDEKPRRVLQLYEEYWRTVREPLTRPSLSNKLDYQEEFEIIKRRTIEFFSAKGAM